MVHPIENNLLEDLAEMHVLLATALAAMDLNSGISASPGASSAFIAAYVAKATETFLKYDLVRMEDTIGMPPVHPQIDDLYFVEDKTNHLP